MQIDSIDKQRSLSAVADAVRANLRAAERGMELIEQITGRSLIVSRKWVRSGDQTFTATIDSVSDHTKGGVTR